MMHEKVFQVESGREVKVIVRGLQLHDSDQFTMEYEILVKEPKEKYFRPTIGVDHPQYWKMKRSTTEQARSIVLEYAGISQRQVNKVIREFNRTLIPVRCRSVYIVDLSLAAM